MSNRELQLLIFLYYEKQKKKIKIEICIFPSIDDVHILNLHVSWRGESVYI